MKKYFFILFAFASYYAQAQKSNTHESKWSVRFTMENVFSTCRYTMVGTDYKPINNSGYYEFKKRTFTPPDNFTPLTIGVLFIYKINPGLRCMFGISQDGSDTRYSLSFRRMDIFPNHDTLYDEQHISSGGGSANTKFPILFYKSIYKTDSIHGNKNHRYDINIDLMAGLNIIYQPGGKNPDLLISSGFDSIPVAPHKYLSYYSNLYATGCVGGAWNLGFNFDNEAPRSKLTGYLIQIQEPDTLK